jgi:hypothetical protein
MTAVATETWFDAVGRVAATIQGIKGAIAYAASTGGQGSTVRAIPRSLADTPAVVLYYRGTNDLRNASWQRVKHNVQLRIYVPRTDLGDGYGTLMTFPRRVMTAFQDRAMAYETLASALVISFGAVEQEEWPPTPDGTGKWYLVLPAEIEAVENTAVTYTQA